MSKLGDRILAGLEDALAFSQGKRGKRRTHRIALPRRVDVRAIRTRLEMTQDQFARTFGFTPHAVRNWEQGKRTPEGAARVLLMVIARDPGGCRASVAHGGVRTRSSNPTAPRRWHASARS